ncbi:hypothetical protein RFI_21350 [Reticulomyxa filosa]|uniref:RRM domain-containing protein n=1 Tax=Reticulomyxa filosa TaxID=46433 RepID=X6MSD3_RETFI|nr:hypothetical protein RFI_21350 [Reticulomyxa filosa]|eukprot:ETO16005.1 hypothetical protein RFI_21350 [Reticulomyxa filosa]
MAIHEPQRKALPSSYLAKESFLDTPLDDIRFPSQMHPLLPVGDVLRGEADVGSNSFGRERRAYSMVPRSRVGEEGPNSNKVLTVNVVNPYVGTTSQGQQWNPGNSNVVNMSNPLNIPTTTLNPPMLRTYNNDRHTGQMDEFHQRDHSNNASAGGNGNGNGTRPRENRRMFERGAGGRQKRETAESEKKQLFLSNVPSHLNHVHQVISNLNLFFKLKKKEHDRAFVQFSRHEDANAALHCPDPVLGDSNIVVQWAHYNRLDFNKKSKMFATDAKQHEDDEREGPAKNTKLTTLHIMGDDTSTGDALLDSIYSVSNASIQKSVLGSSNDNTISASHDPNSTPRGGAASPMKLSWRARDTESAYLAVKEEIEKIQKELKQSVGADVTQQITTLQQQIKEFFKMLDIVQKQAKKVDITESEKKENETLQKEIKDKIKGHTIQLEQCIKSQKERVETLQKQIQQKEKLEQLQKKLSELSASKALAHSRDGFGRGRGYGRAMPTRGAYGPPLRGRGRATAPRGRVEQFVYVVIESYISLHIYEKRLLAIVTLFKKKKKRSEIK